MSRTQVIEGQQEVKGMQTYFPPGLVAEKHLLLLKPPPFPKQPVLLSPHGTWCPIPMNSLALASLWVFFLPQSLTPSLWALRVTCREITSPGKKGALLKQDPVVWIRV